MVFMKSTAEVEEAKVHSGNHTLRKLWKLWNGMIIALITTVTVFKVYRAIEIHDFLLPV